ncbi:MAG: sigma-70 family RNA polymerase sigma factor [Planctomycetia bacterium]|nr:sigma-70 family RNA polymerase sigma factor [Planctomycetia bacterium]
MDPGRRRLLEELVRRHARAVGAVCWARTGSVVDTDDLVQETMMRACRDFGALREPAKFGAWVRGIAENVCREWGRARRKQPPGLGEEAGAVAAPAAPEPAEGAERIRGALMELPEIYRDAIALFHFEKKTYTEIAATLGLSAAAVNARLTKGRAMLRERLKGAAHDVR